MKPSVKRGAFDLAHAREALEFATELVPIKVAQTRENIAALTDLAGATHKHACLAAALSEPGADLLPTFLAAARCNAAPFMLARSDGATAWPLLEDRAEHLAGRVPPSMVSLPYWKRAASLALLARDAACIAAIGSVTASQVNTWHSFSTPHTGASIEAWRAMLMPRTDPRRAISSAFELVEHTKMDDDFEEYINLIDLPVLALFARIAQRDAPAIQDALVEALESHRDYVSREKRYLFPENMVSLPISAAVAVAIDMGFPVEVESELLVITAAAASATEAPVVACPYCSAPFADGVERCAVCLCKTGNDAPLDETLATLRASEAKRCRKCREWMRDIAVVCPQCRTRQ